ncbi:MAG: tetratricopeptide repeat protein [Myxococcota bacterium]
MSPAILLLALLGGQPQPEAEPTRNALIADALEHFGRGDYQEAIDAFEQAYSLDHKPADLFNIGRIYEEMGEPQKAREYYRQFLAHASLTAQERKEGKNRIQALPPPPEPTVAAEPPPADPMPASPKPRRTRPHWAVVTGATLLPMGVVSLASGGVLASTAVGNLRNAQRSADDQTPVQQTPHYAMARRQALASDVLLGLGGTLAITGAAALTAGLILRKRPKKYRGERADLAVTPMGAGLQLNMRF